MVGGGPAGLSAARTLAAAGHIVDLYERGAAFGEPVRTSGGSFVSPLRALGVPSRLWHPVTRLRVTAPSREHVVASRRAHLCVLDVRGLYQWLAVEAARAGARLHLRSAVAGPVLDGGLVTGIRLRGGGEVRASVVVDATGTAGVLARAAGLRHSAPRTAAGLEVEVFAPGYDQREAVLAVGRGIAPGGYGWAFPRGEGRVRLGVGVIRPDSDADLERLLAALLDRVPALTTSCAGMQPIERHSGVMPVYPHEAVPAAGAGMLVVGDAAGHGSTLLGEGIRHAMVSGDMAGKVGARMLAAPAGTRPAIASSYAREWDALVGRQMRIGYAINQRLADFQDRDWDRAVSAVARMSPRLVMQALAGELTPTFALRLIARHPVLALGEGKRFVRAGLA